MFCRFICILDSEQLSCFNGSRQKVSMTFVCMTVIGFSIFFCIAKIALHAYIRSLITEIRLIERQH